MATVQGPVWLHGRGVDHPGVIGLQMKEDLILLHRSRTVMGSLETIIQWNTQGILTSKPNLLEIIDNKPIVIAVQETFLANDVMIKLSNYNVITKQSHFNRRYHGGVALFIHSVCPFNQVTFKLLQQEFT